MKETIKINLNNQLFDLDYDAYDRLKAYLDSLKKKFSKDPIEAEEIVQDIESRIAEILQEKLNKNKQVLTLLDIEEIIGLIGSAEEMESPEDNSESTNNQEYSSFHNHKNSKRLYRDPFNSVISGVCSGIAAYLGIDPVWIRLLFVLLVFLKFSGVLIYIILWIVLQPAYTTAQRLQMHGKGFRVDDWSNTAKKEYKKAKKKVRDFSTSPSYKNAESGISNFFKGLGEVIIIFLKVIMVIIGISLFVALFIGIGGLFYHEHFHFDWNWWPDFDFHSVSFFDLCLMLVIAIPVFGLLLKMGKWILGNKSQNNFLSGIAAAVWVIAFILLVVFSASDKNQTFLKRTKVTEYTLEAFQDEPVHIGLKNSYEYDDLEYYHIFNQEVIRNEDEDQFLIKPEIVIESSHDDKIKLQLVEKYFSLDPSLSSKRLNRIIDYSWNYSNSKLWLSDYYAFDEEKFFRFPAITIKLIIPDGCYLYFDDDFSELIKGRGKAGKLMYMQEGQLHSRN